MPCRSIQISFARLSSHEPLLATLGSTAGGFDVRFARAVGFEAGKFKDPSSHTMMLLPLVAHEQVTALQAVRPMLILLEIGATHAAAGFLLIIPSTLEGMADAVRVTPGHPAPVLAVTHKHSPTHDAGGNRRIGTSACNTGQRR